jgi:PAS domain S-box-containing protein
VADLLPCIAWTASPDGQVDYFNARFTEYTGWPAGQRPEGWLDQAFLHEGDRLQTAKLWERAIAEGDAFSALHRLRRRDGQWRWHHNRASPVRGPGRSVAGFVGMVHDVHDLKAELDQHALLVGELNHRLKNTLAAVQSIAAHSLWQSRSLADFREAFDGRIKALAHVQTMLSSANWRGADLRILAEEALEPYRTPDPQRCRVSGSDLDVRARAALTLKLLFHELATNAAKHGALTVPEGRVAVGWERVEGRGGPFLLIRWQESGGPPVAPPSHRGFGSFLIERSLGYEFDARSELLFRPDGLVCHVSIPWSHLSPAH